MHKQKHNRKQSNTLEDKLKNIKNKIENNIKDPRNRYCLEYNEKYSQILSDISNIIEDLKTQPLKVNIKNKTYDVPKNVKNDILDLIIMQKDIGNIDIKKFQNSLKGDLARNVNAIFQEIDYVIFCKIIDKYVKDILNLQELADKICEIILLSEYLAEKHFSDLPSTKFREFYDYVLRIYENYKKNDGGKNIKWFIEFSLIKPKIAYYYGKEKKDSNKKLALKKLEYLINSVIDNIDNTSTPKEKFKKFENFKTFYESVVAYHRIYAKSEH
ncbi:type III-A CRISPR-associated protein Csm2 [Methanocaldococcus sp.]